MWASAALMTVAVTLSLRWARARVDSIGRARAFPVISVSLCVLGGVGAAVPVARHAVLEHRLTSVATQLTGTDVTVHCQTAGEATIDLGTELGYVKFGSDGVPEHRTVIKWKPCRELRGGLGPDPAAVSRDRLIAVHVLTHESMHMAGTTDEAVTECRAMQRDARTARLLGADPATARALAERYWREVYPAMPDAYRTGDCVPGGALDEHLPDPPWPDPTRK
jgi:hypothetical protein